MYLYIWEELSNLATFTVESIPQQQLPANRDETREKYEICGFQKKQSDQIAAPAATGSPLFILFRYSWKEK